jgi:hypothetical protein
VRRLYRSDQLGGSCLRSQHLLLLGKHRRLEVSIGPDDTERDVPAPRTSAKGSRTLLKFSRLFKARPPDTTLPAEDRSGLDDTVNSSEMYLVDATGQLVPIVKMVFHSCRLTVCTGSIDLFD